MQPFKPEFSYSVRKWEQIRIKGPDKYLARSLFAKIVNVFKQFLLKRLDHRYFTGF